MISRLIAKDAGIISFEDKDLSKWKSKELAKRLAILTQHNNVQMKDALIVYSNTKAVFLRYIIIPSSRIRCLPFMQKSFPLTSVKR